MTRVVDYGGLFWDDVRPGHEFAPRDHRTFRPDGWVQAGNEKLERLRPIAERHGLTLLQLAAQWCLAHEPVACVVPTLIQEIGDGARPIEDKRAELLGDPRRGRARRRRGRADPRDRRQHRQHVAEGRRPAARGRAAPRPLAADPRPRRRRAALGHRARPRPAPPHGPVAEARRFLLSGSGWPYLLVPFIPIAILLELTHAEATIIFGAAAAGVIPTAALMGRATEELAHRSGPGIGGLLNVTFGNAPELIIAFFALNAGLQEVVKASIIGSILGNILLVMGAAMLVGGLKRPFQTFNPTAAAVQSSMLLLAAVALVMPTIFQLVAGGGLPQVGEERVNFGSDLEQMSLIVAFILLGSYAAGLVFSLRSHKALFNPTSEAEEHVERAVVDPHVGASCSRAPASPSESCRRSSSARSPRPPRRSASASSSSA